MSSEQLEAERKAFEDAMKMGCLGWADDGKPINPAWHKNWEIWQAARSQTVSPKAVSSEGGWLIEEWDSKRDQLKATWWALGDFPESSGVWTKDSTIALRFARQHDAQAYIEDLGWTEAKPTEHSWGINKPQLAAPRVGSADKVRKACDIYDTHADPDAGPANYPGMHHVVAALESIAPAHEMPCQPDDLPLSGRWHTGNGYLCCGSFRIARADWESGVCAAEGMREKVFAWIVDRLNASPQPAQQDIELPEGYGPPEGYELTEHLAGIWQYEFQKDGQKLVSVTSWNTPILACIAAWQDKAASLESPQPAQPSVPVEALKAQAERWEATAIAALASAAFDIRQLIAAHGGKGNGNG